MPKSHNVRVKIVNKSGLPMTYKTSWYGSGRLADSYQWPYIGDNDHADVLNYEVDYSLAGCSGYVQYEIGGTLISFAFSNPVMGWNKIGVGKGGMEVWNNMTDHNYDPFTETIQVNQDGITLNFNCQCTGGSTNTCTISISQ